jgi:ribosomal protein S18 acetylase RimI-like enzyme
MRPDGSFSFSSCPFRPAHSITVCRPTATSNVSFDGCLVDLAGDSHRRPAGRRQSRLSQAHPSRWAKVSSGVPSLRHRPLWMATQTRTSPAITYRPISLDPHSRDTAQCLVILIQAWQDTYAGLIDAHTLATLASRPYFSLHSLHARFADEHSLTWVATSRHEPHPHPHEHAEPIEALKRHDQAPRSPLLRALSPAHLVHHPLSLFRTRSRSSSEPEEEIVVGYANALLPVEEGGERTLQGLYIAPTHRGHHIGGHLMDKVLGTSDPARLVCTEGNVRAQIFYEKRGFRLVLLVFGGTGRRISSPSLMYRGFVN